jgi:hypothetical protein
MSRMAGPPAEGERAGSAPESVTGTLLAADEAATEPYQRPNPETIEDADELRASVERVIRRAGRRFREEQERLVAAGIVDEEGRLLPREVPRGVAPRTGGDDR